MGVVYRARDRILRREVALKLIRPESLTEDMRRRFEAEARAVAALDHPNVIRVYDVGGWHDGNTSVPYVALEFAGRGSLGQYLREKQSEPLLNLAEAAHVLRLLAGAMGHVHAKGIVHRDLKPDNVLLAEPAAAQGANCSLGCPKITDFGLARQVEDPKLTRTGIVTGTPQYMSPEQAEGNATVGAPADVYALGVILYRLLTGKLPFEAKSLTKLLSKVCHEPPAPLNEVRSGVPEELDRLCLECLRKDAKGRPTAAELAARLGRFCEAEVGGTTTDVRPVRPPSRRAVMAMGLAGVVAAAAAAGGTWLASGGWHKEKAGEQPGDNKVTGAKPLAGELVVRVWAPERGARGLKIGIDERAVPVREDEQLQAEVTLSEPAYAYLLWIDSKGEVTPLYPWNDDQIAVESVAAAAPAIKAKGFRNPSKETKGWPLDGTIGLDTWLLLARREPWPKERNLADLIGKVPGAPLRDLGEVAVRGWDGGRPVEEVRLDLLRRPKKEAQEIDDQLLQLVGRLKGDFELIRAVQFAHAAKR